MGACQTDGVCIDCFVLVLKWWRLLLKSSVVLHKQTYLACGVAMARRFC